MIVYVNDYYLNFIGDMIRQLEFSLPGKRQWELDEITGRPNYSLTTRSTFPDWCKFFYIKTPKKLQALYSEVNSINPYVDGFYNGNTKELLRLLTRTLTGEIRTTPRLLSAFDVAIGGFYEYIYEYEYEYGETYF